MGLKGGGNVLRTLNNSVERMLIATMESPQGPRSQSAETHDLNEEGQEEAADMDAESLQDNDLAVLVPGPGSIHPIPGVFPMRDSELSGQRAAPRFGRDDATWQ